MMSSSSRGFTLIELMVTLVILAILVILGFPSYEQWIRNTRIRNAAESIQNGLRLARNEASQRGTNVRFQLTGANTADWTVCQLPTANAAATNCTAGTIIQTFPAQGGAGSVVVTVSTDPATILNNAAFNVTVSGGTPNGVTFTSLGRPAASGASSVVRIDTTATAANSRRLVTSISAGGAIHMCDPAFVLSADSPQGCGL
jgi:type IV fimbrial biogenesis protein FimT